MKPEEKTPQNRKKPAAKPAPHVLNIFTIFSLSPFCGVFKVREERKKEIEKIGVMWRYHIRGCANVCFIHAVRKKTPKTPQNPLSLYNQYLTARVLGGVSGRVS